MRIRSLHPGVLTLRCPEDIVQRQWLEGRTGEEYVYFFWGRPRRPLYIGRTWDPGYRLAAHRQKSWFEEASRVVVVPYLTSADAVAAEKQWISECNPVHNKLRYR